LAIVFEAIRGFCGFAGYDELNIWKNCPGSNKEE
jgi:hypothetical protein